MAAIGVSRSFAAHSLRHDLWRLLTAYVLVGLQPRSKWRSRHFQALPSMERLLANWIKVWSPCLQGLGRYGAHGVQKTASA